VCVGCVVLVGRSRASLSLSLCVCVYVCVPYTIIRIHIHIHVHSHTHTHTHTINERSSCCFLGVTGSCNDYTDCDECVQHSAFGFSCRWCAQDSIPAASSYGCHSVNTPANTCDSNSPEDGIDQSGKLCCNLFWSV